MFDEPEIPKTSNFNEHKDMLQVNKEQTYEPSLVMRSARYDEKDKRAFASYDLIFLLH